MARLPRIVIPGYPHLATQRGNRRARTFFEDGDYALYGALLAEAALKAEAEIWCYCLMPNHVHILSFLQMKMQNRGSEVLQRFELRK